MKCPYCGYSESKVVDSRPTVEEAAIRRRRECEKCSKRFTTYEKIEEMPLIIVKKDGSREAYQRSKMLNGILRACEKRPISISTIEGMADEIEKELYNSMDKEIESKKIGEMVMSKLKQIDDVAYVRFASVYRQFKDINIFLEELNKLIDER
ncbi:MAG TPA: transcriptional regulator NrdR [Bacillota bacterium]|nr:transcriptional regulator NrdR [Clostridiaceae bacterium]HNR05293.1 transcriptional regulator NrdR [Bacillota bacterium]HRU42183.1 transcriptional regulator NrdR [Candidatus Diapherotrites archaeon]HNT03753.1 transcriptional regulator NrdR [Bacillota bacterium]HPM00489.1 transcriptional regulator NrdR [Bacillota bacterium]